MTEAYFENLQEIHSQKILIYMALKFSSKGTSSDYIFLKNEIFDKNLNLIMAQTYSEVLNEIHSQKVNFMVIEFLIKHATSEKRNV